MAFARIDKAAFPRPIAIDEATLVPKDLYDTLILAGKKARGRGQHRPLVGGRRLRRSGVTAGECACRGAPPEEPPFSEQKKQDLCGDVRAMLEMAMEDQVTRSLAVPSVTALQAPAAEPSLKARPPSTCRPDRRRTSSVQGRTAGCRPQANSRQPSARAATRSTSLTRPPARARPTIGSAR